MMGQSQQDSTTRRRWGRASLIAVVAAAVLGLGAFSASEAWAARSALVAGDCGEYNWCRQGPGAGDANCIACCDSPESICLFYEETVDQGCLCGG